MVIGAILAGGKGTRVGAGIPKQFLEINNKPIIIMTVDKFVQSNLFDKLYICVNELWLDYTKDLLSKYYDKNITDNISVITGGIERMMSLLNVINDIVKNYGANKDDILITHDAVRPFVSYEILKDSIEQTKLHNVTMASIPVSDTIYKCEEQGLLCATYDRKKLWIGQTPAGCKMDLFNEVISSYSKEELLKMTGTSQLFVNKGIDIHVSEGSVNNFKITTPKDIEYANFILKK
ncbi:MAG: IspD/TarI family cytidylyltransferase [Eubacterium sp.]